MTAVAGAKLALSDAGLRARGDGLAGQAEVDSPAAVAGAEVRAGCRPGVEALVVGLDLPVHVDEAAPDDPFLQRPFVGALADHVRLPLPRVDVHVGAGDVHVAAQYQLLARPLMGRGV